MIIIKNGRKTGLTRGEFLSEASIAHHPILGDYLFQNSVGLWCQCDPPVRDTKPIILHNQYLVEGIAEPFSDRGDSGSLCYVLDEDNNTIRPFGLLHSGIEKSFESVITPLEPIIAYLNDGRAQYQIL